MSTAADQEAWKQLVTRAADSRHIVAWSAKRRLTLGHLARIDGTYLVTAFMSDNSQLTAILGKLRS